MTVRRARRSAGGCARRRLVRRASTARAPIWTPRAPTSTSPLRAPRRAPRGTTSSARIEVHGDATATRAPSTPCSTTRCSPRPCSATPTASYRGMDGAVHHADGWTAVRQRVRLGRLPQPGPAAGAARRPLARATWSARCWRTRARADGCRAGRSRPGRPTSWWATPRRRSSRAPGRSARATSTLDQALAALVKGGDRDRRRAPTPPTSSARASPTTFASAGCRTTAPSRAAAPRPRSFGDTARRLGPRRATTLEYGVADFAIARVRRRRLGDRHDAPHVHATRPADWRNLLQPRHRLPRADATRRGAFKPGFDPTRRRGLRRRATPRQYTLDGAVRPRGALRGSSGGRRGDAVARLDSAPREAERRRRARPYAVPRQRAAARRAVALRLARAAVEDAAGRAPGAASRCLDALADRIRRQRRPRDDVGVVRVRCARPVPGGAGRATSSRSRARSSRTTVVHLAGGDLGINAPAAAQRYALRPPAHRRTTSSRTALALAGRRRVWRPAPVRSGCGTRAALGRGAAQRAAVVRHGSAVPAPGAGSARARGPPPDRRRPCRTSIPPPGSPPARSSSA